MSAQPVSAAMTTIPASHLAAWSLVVALSEVDAQLLGLCWSRDHQLRLVLHTPPGSRAACRARVLDNYEHDRDVLLDLRTWLHGSRT